MLAVAALSAAILTGECGRRLVLVVEDAPGARVLHREPVAVDDTLTLDYTHSSELVPVHGVFRVVATGGLQVVETAFGGFGPGLPELRPGDVWWTSGRLIVHRPRQDPLAELRVRVKTINDYRLVTPAGRRLVLSRLVGDGSAVRVRVVEE